MVAFPELSLTGYELDAEPVSPADIGLQPIVEACRHRPTSSPGTDPAVVTIDGWRLGLAICKDTGMARHADDTAALGFDLYLAGVPESADDSHVQPQRAATVTKRHGVWVAVASFAGPTGGGFDRSTGQSAIWRPDGSLSLRPAANRASW